MSIQGGDLKYRRGRYLFPRVFRKLVRCHSYECTVVAHIGQKSKKLLQNILTKLLQTVFSENITGHSKNCTEIMNTCTSLECIKFLLNIFKTVDKVFKLLTEYCNFN